MLETAPPINYNRSLLKPNYHRLGTGGSTNPFIDVPDSIYALSRLSILVFLCFLVWFGYSTKEVAPNLHLRIAACVLYTLVTTAPLWIRFKGIGLVHPLYLLAAKDFLREVVPNIRIWAQGIEFHSAMSGMSPAKISFLQVELMLLGSFAGLATFAGYFATRGIKWSFIRFRDKQSLTLTAGIFAWLISCASLYLLIDLSGGLEEHLKNISVGDQHRIYVKDIRFGSIYTVLAGIFMVAPALWLLAGKRSPLPNPLFWIISISGIAGSYLAQGRRTPVVQSTIILLACWILRTRQIAIGRMLMIGLLAFLSVGILGEFRRSNWTKSRSVNFEAFTEANINQAFTKSFGELEGQRSGGPTMIIIAKVPEQVPYLLGRNYFNYINRFIPRMIWRDKPQGIGIECARVFYHRTNSGGVPAGEIGEAYWSGGIIGVAIAFFIWGIILKCIGNFFVKFRFSAFASLVYLITLTKLGPSENGFRAWLYMIGPALLILGSMGIFSFNFKRR